MTDTLAIDEAKTLQEADALVDQLAELLEQEFEALKVQDLDQFEVLLSGKTICFQNSRGSPVSRN